MRTSALLALALLAHACSDPDPPQRLQPEPESETTDEEGADLLLHLGTLGYADNTGEEVEEGASPVLTLDAARAEPGATLISSISAALLVDLEGRVLRTWSDPRAEMWSGVELTPDGGLVAVGVLRKQADVLRAYLVGFTPTGKLRWRTVLRALHHDVDVFPDGRLATLAMRPREIPEFSEHRVLDDALLILDAEGAVLEEHSLYDALAARPDLLRFQNVGTPEAQAREGVDLFHANAIDLLAPEDVAELGDPLSRADALVTVRNQDCVVMLDLDSGEAVWAWGPGEVLGPHDASLLPGGRVLLFDNGWSKGGPPPGRTRGWSRVIEVEVASGAIVWEYGREESERFYSASRGSVERLRGGNTLIGDSERGEAFEVTAAGEEVWRYANPRTDEQGRRETFFRARRIGTRMLRRLKVD